MNPIVLSFADGTAFFVELALTLATPSKSHMAS
jgi:hypothetical protein